MPNIGASQNDKKGAGKKSPQKKEAKKVKALNKKHQKK